MDLVYYSFVARGRTPDGVRVTASGYVCGAPEYPFEVFEAAKQECLRLFPGLVLNGEGPTVKKFPSLKQMKRPPAHLPPLKPASGATADAPASAQ